MPSILNSDDGVVSGTSGLKTTGGNDGILSIQNNGTTNVTVTAAGSVGIGTTSPNIGGANADNAILTLKGKASTRGGIFEMGNFGTTGNDQTLGWNRYFDGSTENASIEVARASSTSTAYMKFSTNGGSGSTERARLDSSGRWVVGPLASSGGSSSDTFIEVRRAGDAFIGTQGGSFGTERQGFVYRRNGTYGAMTFATGGVSTASYSFNQFDDWLWYKWDGSTATSAVRMTVAGAMTLRSTLTQNGSPDYAEYFEWSDGNPNAEDRKGKTVVMDGVTGKIRLATSTDPASSIIGVCSRTYGVILDSQELDWADKYLKNEFGEFIKEEVEYVEYLESNGNMRSRPLAGEDIPADATNVRYFKSLNNVVNPNFDPNAEYIPRSKRKEWEPIGLVGKLRILKGQPVGDRWVKMRDISETVEEWMIR